MVPRCFGEYSDTFSSRRGRLIAPLQILRLFTGEWILHDRSPACLLEQAKLDGVIPAAWREYWDTVAYLRDRSGMEHILVIRCARVLTAATQTKSRMRTRMSDGPSGATILCRRTLTLTSRRSSYSFRCCVGCSPRNLRCVLLQTRFLLILGSLKVLLPLRTALPPNSANMTRVSRGDHVSCPQQYTHVGCRRCPSRLICPGAFGLPAHYGQWGGAFSGS